MIRFFSICLIALHSGGLSAENLRIEKRDLSDCLEAIEEGKMLFH